MLHPENKLKDVITYYKDNGPPDLVGMTQRRLAALLDISYTTFRKSLSARTPPLSESNLRDAEKLLKLTPLCLSNGKPFNESELIEARYTTLAPDDLHRVIGKRNVNIYPGGSSDIFAMEQVVAEAVSVYVFSNEDLEYIRIEDGTCMPEVHPNQIVAFAPHTRRTPNRMLLVAEIANPTNRAIRRYDPQAGESGRGAFIHPAGIFPPLDVSLWRVTHIGMQIFSEDGLTF